MCENFVFFQSNLLVQNLHFNSIDEVNLAVLDTCEHYHLVKDFNIVNTYIFGQSKLAFDEPPGVAWFLNVMLVQHMRDESAIDLNVPSYYIDAVVFWKPLVLVSDVIVEHIEDKVRLWWQIWLFIKERNKLGTGCRWPVIVDLDLFYACLFTLCVVELVAGAAPGW